jgi:hypothetical protein
MARVLDIVRSFELLTEYVIKTFINRSFPFVEVKGVFSRLNESHGGGLD